MATRSGYVLSRRRALGLEPRAAGGPVHFFPESYKKFQKISPGLPKVSKKFQFSPKNLIA
jgi:hypothetical protein